MATYIFDYSVTAKCQIMNNCIGLPGHIIANWGKISSNPAFMIDDTGMLMYSGSGQEIEGFYDPDKTQEADYSFTVPIIAPAVTSGAIGVVFRVQNKDNYYCFLWDDGQLGWEKNQRLIRVKNGLPQIVAEASSILKNGYLNMIEVTVVSNRITVKANGGVVFDFTDSENPILKGSYGIAVIGANGARFPGVYDSASAQVDVTIALSGSLDSGALSLQNSRMVNSTRVKELMHSSVVNRMTQMGISSDRYFVYGYTISTVDVFAQAYFKLSEPVVYASHGNCYIYAYLKSQPRVPETPYNFRGTIVGTMIEWRWDDASTVETGYVIRDTQGKTIGTVQANTTVFYEPIKDDGITITRRLYAYNNVGESEYAEASVYIPIITPAAPSYFAGQALSTGSIKWSWSISHLAEYYELVDEEGNVIAIIPGDVNSYTETGLKPRKLYTRGIRAVRKGNASETIFASAETLGASGLVSVEIPVDFEGEVLNPRTVRWVWNYYGKAAKFVLYDLLGNKIAEVPGDARSYIEYDLTPGAEYTRILIAVDSAGYRSAPVIATVKLVDDIAEIVCDVEDPHEPRYVGGFASGVGDGDDLETRIVESGTEVTIVTHPLYEEEEEVTLEKAAECTVQFKAKGTELVERDYGQYDLTCTLMPGAEVEFNVKSEVYEPAEASYRIEADIKYTRLKTVPFEYDIEVTYKDSARTSGGIVDIVWLVDFSSSMDVYAEKVAQNAQLFAQNLNSSNIDYRLAVIKYTDVAHVITSDGDAWTTDPTVFAQMVTASASGSSGIENGINAIYTALSSYQFREGALKYLIILTDEDADDAGSYDIPSLINTLKSNNVTFSGIVQIGASYPYPTLAQETGGTTIDIDSADWGVTMSQIVNNIKQNIITTATATGLTAQAQGGLTYSLADPRTVSQIISDYISSGGTGFPQDFLASGNYEILSYKLIPKVPYNVRARFTNGSSTSTSGDVKIEAFSTAVEEEQQVTVASDILELKELSQSATAQAPQIVYGNLPLHPTAFHIAGYADFQFAEKVEAESPSVIKDSYSISSDGKAVWLKGYIEYTFSTPADAIVIQMRNSDHNDGLAHVFIDGTDYGYFSTNNRGDNFICISELPIAAHTVRVEAVGGDIHVDFLGTINLSPSAAWLMKQMAQALPELNGTYYIFTQIRCVNYKPQESVVYVTNHGLSPVYAYPARPLYYYTTWHFSDIVYADDGEKVLVDTKSLTPLGRDGKPYTGSNIKWILEVIKAAPAVVKWQTTDELTVSHDDVVIARNDVSIQRNIKGWTRAGNPTRIDTGILFPDIPPAVDYRLNLQLAGDANIYTALTTSNTFVYTGESKTVDFLNETINVFANRAMAAVPRVWFSEKRCLSVNGTVELSIDIELPANSTAETYEFILDNPEVSASFKNSGGTVTTDPSDKLVLSYYKQETKTITVMRRGTPLVQRVYVPLCQTYSAKLFGMKVPGKIATYACITETPGADVIIKKVNDIPDSDYVEIEADIVFESPFVGEWLVASKNGFYYYAGEERYLYARSDVNAPAYELADAVVTLSATIDKEGVAEERVLALHTVVPRDDGWHQVSNDRVIDLFLKCGMIKPEERESITGFAVKKVDGDLEARCDSGGMDLLEVRAAGVVLLERNTAVLDNEMKATVSPLPKSFAPVTVLLEDGTPLRYVRFKNGEDYYSLDCTERLRGSGEKFVYLAYSHIDPESIRIYFTPYGSAQRYTISRFKLCRNKLYLPVRVTEQDEVEVSYRLLDSFTIVPNIEKDNAVIKVHTDRAQPGSKIYVYYETSNNREHLWEEPNMNPLLPWPQEGFIRLGYLPPESPHVNIRIRPEAVTPNIDKEIAVSITTTYNNGVPAPRETVDVITSDGTISLETNECGSGTVYIRTSSIPEGGITVSGFGTTMSVPVQFGQAAPGYVCWIIIAHDKVVPNGKLTFSVYVTKDGVPASGVRVAARAKHGTVLPHEGVTDPLGRANFTYTAPNIASLQDVIEAECIEVLSQPGTAKIYVGGLVSMLPTADNLIGDIPEPFQIDWCGDHTIDTLASIPPEFL